MKKSLLIAAVAFAMASLLSSCKKDYTCTCTDTATNPASVSTGTIYNVTKQQATTWCAFGQGNATTTCKL